MNEPYDPKPRALEPAQNGFIWCEKCQEPQPAAGHPCRGGVFDRSAMDAAWEGALEEIRKRGGDPEELLARASLNLEVIDLRGRVAFAESLLCAMALSHGLNIEALSPDARAEWRPRHFDCVFCEAAR